MRAKKRAGNPILAVGYIRVSTDEQHLGPEAQGEAIRRYCANHPGGPLELAQIFIDKGVSGAADLDKRPALQDALDAIREHGAGVLVVSRRDRLAREVLKAALIEQLIAREGAVILCADGAGNGDGPEARLMRQMLDAFSEYERQLIRARTRAALGAKKRRGEKLGGQSPFGYRLAVDGKTLEKDETEQRTLAQVRELQKAGLSVRGIASELNARGIPARGRRWHKTTVSRLLQAA